VPPSELERIRGLEAAPAARAAAFADACRLNVLSMVMEAGSGHLGTSFSCLDILSWLHLEVLRPEDRYFSSKGHDAPALYAVLIGLGRLPYELVHRLRRLDGLPGHPDLLATPEVVTNTGSLGMGVSKARGFVLADRLAGRSGSVYVLTGDGELQEGQFWESLQPTANRGLGEITVVVDHSKLQSDTWVSRVSDLGDLEVKAAAFGWAVARCDGNDVAAFAAALEALGEAGTGRPKLLVADTRKGAGVSFMEAHDLPDADTSLYRYHSGAPSEDDYERALGELVDRLDAGLRTAGAGPIELESTPARPRPARLARPERLVAVYGRALVAEAEREPRLVALDADLRLDTGLVEFRDRFPERFFECGIAEQDMVSQAGTMALAGLLPVVHSFACFLSTRPNEQIYNNATEGTKVIYVGSLAGVVPGGPGHSHQSVRDIAILGSIPGLTLLEPSSEREAALCVRWAVHDAPGSVYVRLVSVPWALGFEWPPQERLEPGRGTVIRDGRDGTIVATGPVLLSLAWRTRELLESDGLSFGLVALPWLRDVDGDWLARQCSPGHGPVLCLDNHQILDGHGSAIHRALHNTDPSVAARVYLVGPDGVPRCGTDDEVLNAHGLVPAKLAERAKLALGLRPSRGKLPQPTDDFTTRRSLRGRPDEAGPPSPEVLSGA
jgi:transketolase